MDAMGSALHSVVDATLAYPGGIPTMLDLVAGRIPEVGVQLREQPIPADLEHVDYEADPHSRVRVQRWINGLWAAKDEDLARMLGTTATAAPAPARLEP